MLGKNLIQAAAVKAGAAGGLGIEELFQTWLYTGNGSTQTITNGIDLAGEGGLVWIKRRSSTWSHILQDTERGINNFLSSDSTSAQGSATYLNSFDSTGFTVTGATFAVNDPSSTYASWTFRKAPGFFDVVTFTAGSNTNRRVSHSLGSAPGMIIMKRTDGSNNWAVYHRSLGRSSYIFLNLTSAVATQSNIWGATDPTSTDFGIDEIALCVNGASYVAYLFAHDEQIFGEGGDQSVIKCGSYTGNGSTSGPVIDLGWEPQWVLIKATSTTSSWLLYDVMRGWTDGGPDNALYPNLSNAEDTTNSNLIKPLATGFQLTASYAGNFNGISYVYIAIRRGPMKTTEDATKVFYVGTAASSASYSVGFPSDAFLMGKDAYTGALGSRLTGGGFLRTPLTDAENASLTWFKFDQQNNFEQALSAASTVRYNFRRAPGFFDVVAYDGGGTSKNHNLGVKPELAFIKVRSTSFRNWIAAVQGGTGGYLNTSDPINVSNLFIDLANATTTTFPVNGNPEVGQSGQTYIAYLFATLPGISKVFSFTGNGTSQTIDCGFAAGARFVLLKRTDSAGNWLVADTARGIISGNDPLLYLNSAAAEITTLDWIDPHSSGFIVNQEATANANVGGATYIGLAIA